jgi:hypothetical protein
MWGFDSHDIRQPEIWRLNWLAILWRRRQKGCAAATTGSHETILNQLAIRFEERFPV